MKKGCQKEEQRVIEIILEVNPLLDGSTKINEKINSQTHLDSMTLSTT